MIAYMFAHNLSANELTKVVPKWSCKIADIEFDKGFPTNLTIEVNSQIRRKRVIHVLVESPSDYHYTFGVSGYMSTIEKLWGKYETDGAKGSFLNVQRDFKLSINLINIMERLNKSSDIKVDDYNWSIPVGKKSSDLDEGFLIFKGINGNQEIKLYLKWSEPTQSLFEKLPDPKPPNKKQQ